MIRIKNFKLPFDHNEQDLKDSLSKRLLVCAQDLGEITLIRKSLDARSCRCIEVVYTIDVRVKEEPSILAQFANDVNISLAPCMKYQMPQVLRKSKKCAIVVGSGPCGLFAALILAQLGQNPIVVERGKDVDSRIKDVQEFWDAGKFSPASNVQFGEGGAGTFSDGKLTTQIKDKLNRSRKVLQELVAAGAPSEILHEAKPHIGTDNLITVVKEIRKQIISLGGEVRFETKLTDIKIENGEVVAAVVNDSELIETDAIILALGHSARDTFEHLGQLGIDIEAKAFSMGVRIEHPQAVVNQAKFGKFADEPLLGSAEYKLVAHCDNGASAYTFCMCPGGEVVASSSEVGGVVTNGMSRYARNSSNANSALLVGVAPSDFGSSDPLAGIEFQRKWERKAFALGGSNYFAPVQLVGDFLLGIESKSLGAVKPSYKPGVTPCDLADCLPDFVCETLRKAIPMLEKKLKGFSMYDAVMTAIESRSSSPVRILRDESFQSTSIKGLYPAGEGAGYAGGIISAAIDGIKVAEALCLETLSK